MRQVLREDDAMMIWGVTILLISGMGCTNAVVDTSA